MYHITRFFIIGFFFFITFQAVAQNVEFTRSNFPNDRSGLREASRNLRRGDRLFEQGGGKYDLALEYYLKAHNFNPKNAWLNYKIGVCYLNSIHHEKAIDFFEEAVRLNVPTLDVYFDLGHAFQLNYRFDEAIDQYRFYRQSLTPQELIQQRDKVDKRIAECNYAKKLVEKPVRVFIDNLGNRINSEYDDYSPVINADGTKMLFTTRRPLRRRPRADRNDHKYFENILETRLIRDRWQTPKEPGRRINTRSHDASAGLSHDGNTLLIYRGKRGGDIHESHWDGEQWSRPKRLHRRINSDYWVSSATLSPDGRTLYFVSDRPGGYGGKDIWQSRRDDRGDWSAPVNLGTTVNTEYDEASVFMHPDGKTLYFSSQGHNSMGGFDIFKTQYIGGRWTEPENLGHPINTPGDDLFFSMTKDGETGFYSTYREDGYGGSDIYMITFLGPEKPLINTPEQQLIASLARPADDIITAEEIEVTPMTLLRGTITDQETEEPLFATIELYDNEEELLLAEFTSNERTGDYAISLPGGKNYGIAVQAEDYLFHSENIDITESMVHREIINDIQLKRIEVGKAIVLENIFFDLGQATLRPESYAELGILYQLMEDNPDLRVKISGHTCTVGGWELNKRLSEDRARAVVEFLIDRGIDRNRLEHAGHAYSQPIASNETEEGREKNRRTEFEIIE